MAFIMEQAGGKASDGHKRILDIQPKNIHERSPIFMGSKEDVEDVEALYKKHAKWEGCVSGLLDGLWFRNKYVPNAARNKHHQVF